MLCMNYFAVFLVVSCLSHQCCCIKVRVLLLLLFCVVVSVIPFCFWRVVCSSTHFRFATARVPKEGNSILAPPDFATGRSTENAREECVRFSWVSGHCKPLQMSPQSGLPWLPVQFSGATPPPTPPHSWWQTSRPVVVGSLKPHVPAPTCCSFSRASSG